MAEAPQSHSDADLARAASDKIPKLHQTSYDTKPTSMLTAIGTDASTVLKAALWRNDFKQTVTARDVDFFSISHHRGGAAVREARDPDVPGVHNTVSIQNMLEDTQEWISEGEVEFAHFHISTALVTTVFQQILDRDPDFDAFDYAPVAHGAALLGAVTSAASMLLDPRLPPSRMLLDSWGVVLADTLVRHHSVHRTGGRLAPLGPLMPVNIRRVVDYIEAHIGEDLSLNALAGVAAQNVYHFAKRFRETVGESPHAYVLRRRVERAKEMLHATPLPLVQIAYACGFSSQSHFTTVFGAYTGATPGKYRRDVRD